MVKCVGFDTASDAPVAAYGANFGVTSAVDGTTPQIDTSVSASGGGSLKFTIPSNSPANTSGSYFTNFSRDLSVQFGENSEFYVQWRQRFSPEFVSTLYAGSGGIKQVDVTTGDQPNKLYASCEATEIVVQTYYVLPQRFPIIYQSCTGSTSHGAYDGFFEPYGSYDFKLQNARATPYCLYTQKYTNPMSYFPPSGNCFGWFPNEWMTFQMHVKVGPRVNDEFTNSYVELWMAREGQPSELVIQWGPYNLSVGSLTDNQRYGKIYLLPYQTGKDPTQSYPTAYTWYDELIISRNKIADPGATSTTSTTTAPAVDTTAPSVPSTLSATAASSSEIDLSWNASTDNVGVTGYKIYRNGNFVASATGTSYADTVLAANTAYTYAVAAYDAAGNLSAQSARAQATTRPSSTTTSITSGSSFFSSGSSNQQLSSLAANTVVELPPLSCTTPDGEYPGNCKLAAGVDSSLTYDPKTNRVIVYGGGHAATNYDSIAFLDMATLTWQEEYQPTPCSAMTWGTLTNYNRTDGTWLAGPSGPYARPVSRHTYDQMAVVGDELLVLAGVGGNGYCTQLGSSYTGHELDSATAKGAHYNFLTKTWALGADTSSSYSTFPAIEYDPLSNKVLLFGYGGLEVYDPITKQRTWAIPFGSVGSTIVDEQGNVIPFNNLTAEVGYARDMVYYPPNQKMYYFGNNNGVFEITLNRGDFSKSTIVKLTTSGTASPLSFTAMAYDSVNRIIGGRIYQNTFYAFDPTTKSWTSKVTQGATPGNQDGHTITYDSADNVFVFITADKKTWAYRYGTGM